MATRSGANRSDALRHTERVVRAVIFWKIRQKWRYSKPYLSDAINLSMDWKLFAQLAMTFAVAILGGWLGHYFSARRDLTNERRKLRITYL